MGEHRRFKYEFLEDLKKDIETLGVDIPLSEHVDVLKNPVKAGKKLYPMLWLFILWKVVTVPSKAGRIRSPSGVMKGLRVAELDFYGLRPPRLFLKESQSQAVILV